MGAVILSQGYIGMGVKVHHSPQCSAEVENKWSYTSALPVCIHDVDRGNFFYVKKTVDQFLPSPSLFLVYLTTSVKVAARSKAVFLNLCETAAR